MTSDEHLWVVLPLVLRTLGEDDGNQLMERAIELARSDSSHLDRMAAGAARIELVDRLRVERSVSGQEAFATREWREIDQLTAYLLATCIPIAAGQPGDLAPATFESFLSDLPAWTQDWCATNYLVLPSGHDPKDAAMEWAQLELASRIRLIAAHLAAVVRAYQTTVDYQPFDEHDRLHLTPEVHQAPFEFAWVHRAADPTFSTDMTVGLTTGLPEAEVLRFLLVVGFRNWLSAADDPAYVLAYWTRRHLRFWGLRALQELEHNVQHIHGWAARGLYPRPPHADFVPLTGLETQAVQTLADDPSAISNIAHLELTDIQTYLAAADRINTRIRDLNDRADDPEFDVETKASEEEQLFGEVLADPETAVLMEQTQALHRHLSRSLAASL